jgi:hypothetical protein
MSPDPSGERYADLRNPQSLNLYSYVANDPLKYVDPLGLMINEALDPDSGGAGPGGGVGWGDEGGGDDGGIGWDGVGGISGPGMLPTIPPQTVTVTATPDPNPEPISLPISVGIAPGIGSDPSGGNSKSAPKNESAANPPLSPEQIAQESCLLKAQAASAADFAAMKTMPNARTVVGGGIIGVIFGAAAGSNPIGWASGAATGFRDNIGGAILGTAKAAVIFNGCMAAAGFPQDSM